MQNKKGVSITLDMVLVDEARKKCSKYGVSFNRLVNSFLEQFVKYGEVMAMVKLNNNALEVESTRGEDAESPARTPRGSVAHMNREGRGNCKGKAAGRLRGT